MQILIDTEVSWKEVIRRRSRLSAQVVEDLRPDVTTHSRLGARIPKGVLLVGPSGTSKTLLVRSDPIADFKLTRSARWLCADVLRCNCSGNWLLENYGDSVA